jgi:hypothetical protein
LLRGLADRSRDQPLERPADAAFAIDDRPPAGQTALLTLQILAIQ